MTGKDGAVFTIIRWSSFPSCRVRSKADVPWPGVMSLSSLVQLQVSDYGPRRNSGIARLYVYHLQVCDSASRI